MRYVVIGISGKAQSGKTTSYNIIKDIIKEEYKDNMYRTLYLPFAGKLKSVAIDLFDWSGDKELYKNADGSMDETKGRGLLIALGQYMRKIKPNIWAAYVKKEILTGTTDPINDKTIYLIDDIRFKNEMETLKTFGKKLVSIRLSRESQLKIDDISENDLDDYTAFDFTIENNGTIAELKDKLRNIIKEAINRSNGRIHA